MTNLRMCCESGCGKIMVNNKWVGREYPKYQELIDEAGEEITHGYCNEHRYNNSLIRRQMERKRMRELHLI